MKSRTPSIIRGPSSRATDRSAHFVQLATAGRPAHEDFRRAGSARGVREFLAAGREALKSRPRPEEDRRLVEARCKVGELSLGLDVLRAQRGDRSPPSPAEALNVAGRLELRLARVCRVARVSRSAACEQRRRRSASEPTAPLARRRPGPVGALPDPALLAAIRREIAASPFVGEGHKKLTARLRRRGICTSRKRVLRLMREHGLLAPTPQVRRRAKRLHDGRITTDVPDELWATDPTEAWTRRDGRCAVFALVDHCTGEAWIDAAPRMDRFAAADLLREAIIDRFGSVDVGAATGLKLRHDGGSCFRSAHYQTEIDHLGIDRSPAFHYEPETNGVVEKFIQTLKEQVLWLERFDTLEQLRARVRQFAALYNENWLLERHGYRSPRQARAALTSPHQTVA
jgi:putative transposase